MMTDEQTRLRARRAFFVGLGITVAYVSMRSGVYAVARDHHWPWVVRDTAMDIPRLITFGIALWFGARTWGRRALGLHFEGGKLGLGLGSIAVALWMAEHVFREKPFGYATNALVVLAVNSIAVALVEETLFRGVLFKALGEWKHPALALWGSSALFAVYHVQAQPIDSWPSIFMIGVVFAIMRSRGVGLWWLILAHAMLDTMIFLGSYGPTRLVWWPPLVFVLEVALVGILYARWRRLGLTSRPQAGLAGTSSTTPS